MKKFFGLICFLIISLIFSFTLSGCVLSDLMDKKLALFTPTPETPEITETRRPVKTPAEVKPEKTVLEETPLPAETGDEDKTVADENEEKVTVDAGILRNGKPLDRALNVPDKYKSHIAGLVSYLIEGIDNDFVKAKVLHDWIALNIAYDTDAYFSGDYGSTEGVDVFSSGKSVCGGYSSLYEEFCDLAGIKCVTVNGLSKGYGFSNTGELGDHAWNAVEIDGKWYLVDTTWDAGYLEGKDFIWSYGTHYLFSKPESFIYTHYPEDPQWQLLKPPVTEKEFQYLVYVNGRFFSSGLEVVFPLNYRNTVDKEFEAKIKAPGDMLLIASLKKDGREFENYTLVQREKENYIVKVRFPHDSDDYTLTVFGKSRVDEGNYYDVMEYKLASNNGGLPFPGTYSTFGEQNCYLFSPLEGELKRDSTVHFKCRVEGGEEVAVVIDERDFIPLEKKGDNIYEGNVKIPAGGKCSINVKLPGNSQYWGIAEYKLK